MSKIVSKTFAVTLGASAFAALSTSAALAQETPSDEDHKHPGHIYLDGITVTGTPFDRPLGKQITNTSVLTDEELRERAGNTIGETLRLEPGISSTAFGPGAGRPIIRGLGGDRIRVLQDGIGSFDAAQTSPDHAVPIEPALAETIEVYRGPAALLYGSSAAGGVVNVISGKIPREIPENNLEGAVRYTYSTVNNQNEVAGGVNAALGNFVFHAEGAFRDADNYDIPGLVGSDNLIAALLAADPDFDPDERFETGFLPNSDLQTTNGAFGASYVFDNGDFDGFFGASFSIIDTNYGLPAGVLTEEDLEGEEDEGDGETGGTTAEVEEEEEEEGIRIDLVQRRYDVQGEINGNLGIFQTAKVAFGYGDYRHFELEGDEIGTEFFNDEFEGRIELVGKQVNLAGGALNTAVGVQFRNRDFSAIGAEAFVPPSEQTQFALFGLAEYTTGALILDTALRYENVNNETSEFIDEEDGVPMAIDNTFNNFSISGGLGINATDNIFLGVNAARSERAPSLEESFSFGPHLATQFFEVGDPTLETEVSRSIEGTIRGEFGPITLTLNGFYNSFDNFIFEQQTGEILDGLPVFAFVAADTDFRGFEAEMDADLGAFPVGPLGDVDFALHAQADYVRATSPNAFGNDNQPRIPPVSGLLAFSAGNDLFDFRTEVEFVGEQNEVADFELPTDGFTFVNLFLTVHPFESRPNIAFDIRATNLTDDEGRVHASFLKDTAPLPGRDVRFGVRVAF